MITVIEYLDTNRLSVVTDNGIMFVCPTTDFNRHHRGYWHSTVVAFVPDDRYFFDGMPVDEYEEYGYDDRSGIFYDLCQVCNIPTGGDKYCGSACALYDQTKGRMDYNA